MKILENFQKFLENDYEIIFFSSNFDVLHKKPFDVKITCEFLLRIPKINLGEILTYLNVELIWAQKVGHILEMN